MGIRAHGVKKRMKCSLVLPLHPSLSVLIMASFSEQAMKVAGYSSILASRITVERLSTLNFKRHSLHRHFKRKDELGKLD